ncbi:hypothetical protein E4U54_003893 [Claviceps lovelessii]|nr:hypothetical protein E4U54_003893 [Claviceps lovelessii]
MAHGSTVLDPSQDDGWTSLNKAEAVSRPVSHEKPFQATNAPCCHAVTPFLLSVPCGEPGVPLTVPVSGISSPDDVLLLPWLARDNALVLVSMSAPSQSLFLVGVLVQLSTRIAIPENIRPQVTSHCLVRRRFRAPPADQQWPNSQQQYGGYYYQQPQQSGYQPAYPMNDMPLPAYDPNRPPVYSGPPEGGSKVDPSQNRAPAQRPPEANAAPDYAPPPGPPPPANQ